jgi:AcrR family transcriptional regulator
MAVARAQYHHGDLAQTLLDQALVSLRTVSAEELSLRALSQEIGVSHSAAYRHFPSKRALLDGVCERGFASFRDALLAARQPLDSPLPAQFERMAGTYIRFALAQPNLYSLMFGPGFAERMQTSGTCEAARESFGVLMDSVHQALTEGLFATASPFQLSQTIWALLHGFALFAMHGEVDAQHAAPMAVQAWSFLYQGIRSASA